MIAPLFYLETKLASLWACNWRPWVYLGLLLACTLTSRVQADDKTLRILAWEGYADPEVQHQFTRESHIKLDVTIVYSDDELWSRANNTEGKPYDLIAVNTAELQRYIDKSLVRPIDPQRIPNLSNQIARFQNREQIPGLTRQHNIYAIPYTFSEMGLIYNRKLVTHPPTSINALWDSQYKGQVLAFNTSNHNFTLAAFSLGFARPFDQTPDQLYAGARHLVDLRRNILSFYNTPNEVVNLFKNNKIALIFANFGTQQLKALEDVGADVGYSLPDDGTLAWLDCWAVGAQASHLAEEWINFTLKEDISKRLTALHGLGNTLSENILYKRAHIHWLQPIENAELRNRLWEQVYAGDTPEKF